eukprot:SM000007S20865  [mRNA]  locus=s7:611829:626196:+ [translate_table: standard]
MMVPNDSGGMLLQRALRELCSSSEWNYAVLWKRKRRSRVVLTWEDGYCQFSGSTLSHTLPGQPLGLSNVKEYEVEADDVGTATLDQNVLADTFARMSYHVYALGEGIIGRVAFTGKHQWIFSSLGAVSQPSLGPQNLTRASGRQMSDKYPAGWQHQFAAGIKTIAIIAVPDGVIQLGSIHMVPEDLDFICHVRSILSTLHKVPGAFSPDMAHDTTEESGLQRLPPQSMNSVQHMTQLPSLAGPAGALSRTWNLPSGLQAEHTRPVVKSLQEPLFGESSWSTQALPSFEHKEPQRLSVSPAMPDQVASCKVDLSGACSETYTKVEPGKSFGGRMARQTNGSPRHLSSAQTLSIDTVPLHFFEENGFGQQNSSVFSQHFELAPDGVVPASSLPSVLPGGQAAYSLYESLSPVRQGQNYTLSMQSEAQDTWSELLAEVRPPPALSTPDKGGYPDQAPLLRPPGQSGSRGPFLFRSPGPWDRSLPSNAATQAGQVMSGKSSATLTLETLDMLRAQQEPGPYDASFGSLYTSLLASPVSDFRETGAASLLNTHNNRPWDSSGVRGHVLGDELSEALGSSYARCRRDGQLPTVEHAEEWSCCSMALAELAAKSSSDGQGPKAEKGVLALTKYEQPPCLQGDPNNHPLDGESSLLTSDSSFDPDLPPSECLSVLPVLVGDRSHTLSQQPQAALMTNFAAQQGSMAPRMEHSALAGLDPSMRQMDDVSVFRGRSSCYMASEQQAEASSMLFRHNPFPLGFCQGPSSAPAKQDFTRSKRKRARKPGDPPRPRPRDRQQIQDRVKELRDIVPNSQKCSIDGLLEKTIKHVLFLRQTVTIQSSYKQASSESDSDAKQLSRNCPLGCSSSSSCPIHVETLRLPRQLAVEVHCKMQHSFLEVASHLQSLGLTILKGTMEMREGKLWAQYIVEATRDIHNVEITWALTKLLQANPACQESIPSSRQTSCHSAASMSPPSESNSLCLVEGSPFETSGAGMKWLEQVEEAVPAREGSPSKGPVYICSTSKKDGPLTLGNVSTLWEMFSTLVLGSASASKHATNNMLGRREIVDGKAGRYVFQSYAEVFQLAKEVGSAIRSVGVEPKGRCGIYGANCPEWVTAMEACNSQSIMCVPLYDTLGADAIEFIVNHAEISIIFIQETKLPLLLDVMPKCTQNVKSTMGVNGFTAIVSFSSTVEEAMRARAAELGINVSGWSDFVKLGKEKAFDPTPPTAEDICTIMYTSGTTGEPKGVLLSHQAICTEIASVYKFLVDINEEMTQKDRFLSYLPLAHIFDRVSEEFFIYIGGEIGFWQGDIKKLVEDIGEYKPTYFAGVPRVFERIYSGINTRVNASGGLKKLLFNWGFHNKVNRIRKGLRQEKAAPFFDKLVFSKIKQQLGGSVRVILSGAAPLAPHIEEFLKVVMCAPVVQGYGLTESCAGSFISYPNLIEQAGTVGPPLPNLDVRLESVPEMNYDALGTPSRGELCLRGKSLFNGYYKRPDLTTEAYIDGWFHTGDIGEWQRDGSLKIFDRKKNIFKLSQGEYVAVENLENVYGNCSATDQVWVYGNSFESVLVAVAVPNEANLKEWAKTNNVEGDYTAICSNPQAKKYVLDELTGAGKKGKVLEVLVVGSYSTQLTWVLLIAQLKGFEMIKAVHLEPQAFDLGPDLLTPTYKKKRPQLLKHYQAVVDAMYADLRKAEAAKRDWDLRMRNARRAGDALRQRVAERR